MDNIATSSAAPQHEDILRRLESMISTVFETLDAVSNSQQALDKQIAAVYSLMIDVLRLLRGEPPFPISQVPTTQISQSPIPKHLIVTILTGLGFLGSLAVRDNNSSFRVPSLEGPSPSFIPSLPTLLPPPQLPYDINTILSQHLPQASQTIPTQTHEKTTSWINGDGLLEQVRAALDDVQIKQRELMHNIKNLPEPEEEIAREAVLNLRDPMSYLLARENPEMKGHLTDVREAIDKLVHLLGKLLKLRTAIATTALKDYFVAIHEVFDHQCLIEYEASMILPSFSGDLQTFSPFDLRTRLLTVNEREDDISNYTKADPPLFLVFEYVYGPYKGALYEVRCKGPLTFEPAVLRPICNFWDFLKTPPHSTFLAARTCTRAQSKLYLIWCGIGSDLHCPCPFPTGGYALEFRSGSLHRNPISAPKAFKKHAELVSAYGNLYLIANTPISLSLIPDPSFEKYCPDVDKWIPMPSFPFYSQCCPTIRIIGYAVCHGVILFSFCNFNRVSKVFAFHESQSKWSEVKVVTPTVFAFYGRAVIVNEIFYALSAAQPEDEIIAFSFKINLDDAGNVEYLISSLFALRLEFRSIPPTPSNGQFQVTESLVYLGNMEFIYIRTTTEKSPDSQSFYITKFAIVDEGGHQKIKNLGQVVLDDVDIKYCPAYIHFSFVQGCEDVEPEEDHRRMAAMLKEAASRRKLVKQDVGKGKIVGGSQKLLKSRRKIR